MTTGYRKPGDFCWINLLTPAPEAARAFFAELLEWTYTELPGGMGHRILVGGKNVGGLFDLANPGTPPGTPPGIGVMVRVDDADATVARAAQLGGTSRPAFDIMEQGRMAECTDPNGAAFDLWQPKLSLGADADTAVHGTPSWFETLTTDTARAAAFYGELFGWTAEPMALPGMDYTTFSLGGAPVAGMMAITPEMGPMPPHWAVYFTVRDTDAAVARAASLGATTLVPPQDIPGVGRFAGLTSPQGVMFYVIRYTS